MDPTLAAGVAVVIAYVAGLLTKKFLPKYMEEKGRNLATREDIGAITREVERARQTYTEQLEAVRADLQLMVDWNKTHHNRQQESVISLYDAAVALLIPARRVWSVLADISADELEQLSKEMDTGIAVLYRQSFAVALICSDQPELVTRAQSVSEAVNRLEWRFRNKLMQLIRKRRDRESRQSPEVEIFQADTQAVKELQAVATDMSRALEFSLAQYAQSATRGLLPRVPLPVVSNDQIPAGQIAAESAPRQDQQVLPSTTEPTA